MQVAFKTGLTVHECSLQKQISAFTKQIMIVLHILPNVWKQQILIYIKIKPCQMSDIF